MTWYIASVKNDLTHGDVVFSSDSYQPLCLADSHELAVACWRYTLPPPELTYYRVEPYAMYEGEPTPVTEIPGLVRCHAAKVLGKVHDGTGGVAGEVRHPRWENAQLWPLIKMTRWPDDNPMYNEQGFIINLPDPSSGRFDEETTVKILRERQYLLPNLVKADLERIRPGRFGTDWPVWGPPHR